MRSHPDEKKPIRSISLLGVSVTPMTVADLFEVIDYAIRHRRHRLVIGNHNLHSIALYHRNPLMRRFFARADYVFIDGMPLIFHAKLLGAPISWQHRTTVIDWLVPLLEMSRRKGWRVVFVGGKPEVVSEAEATLKERIPDLDLFVHHGYFDSFPDAKPSAEVIKLIENRDPQILLVGMGMPRQEEWIIENLGQLQASVIIPIGAGMDYVAGAIPTPPRWMGNIGLEWMYRLLSEPKRLAHRYLVEPWSIVPLAMRDYFTCVMRRRP